MENKDILPVKSDVIFRLFFADERNAEFLISFLKSALDLPDDDYDVIEIADPHLLREYPTDKLGIIDVKLKTKSRKIVHIEIQLAVTPELKNRIVFYDAKLVTEQIGSGDDYGIVKRVISIVITNDELIENSKRYHHRFRLYDKNAGVEFTDLLEIHTLELSKLPHIVSVQKPTRNQRSVSRRRGRAPKRASVRVYADARLSKGCADERRT